jgi:hypothetical protein
MKKLVSDNLYSVSFGTIKKNSFQIGDVGFDFSNPRILCDSFNNSPVGMDTDEMEYLKESIKRKGLLTPLIGRLQNDEITLINGHRRYLAIEQLIKENADCYDLKTGNIVPAGKLYEDVLIRLFDNVNDIDSYHLAFEEDKTKVKFGHGVEYKFVDYCMDKNIDDSKILLMTGNTQAWLDNVKALLNKINGDHPIDQEIRDCIFNEKMSIAAAKILADISDPEEKTKAFKDAYKCAEEEANAKIEKLNKQLKTIRKRQDTAKAQTLICAKNNDIDGLKSAEDILEEGLQAETEILTKQQSISPVITTHNIPASNSIGPRASKSKGAKKDTPVKAEPVKAEDVVSNDQKDESLGDMVISKPVLTKEWLGTIEKIKDNELEGIQIDKLVLDITRDLIVSLINDQSCADFLIHWSKELRRNIRIAE